MYVNRVIYMLEMDVGFFQSLKDAVRLVRKGEDVPEMMGMQLLQGANFVDQCIAINGHDWTIPFANTAKEKGFSDEEVKSAIELLPPLMMDRYLAEGIGNYECQMYDTAKIAFEKAVNMNSGRLAAAFGKIGVRLCDEFLSMKDVDIAFEFPAQFWDVVRFTVEHPMEKLSEDQKKVFMDAQDMISEVVKLNPQSWMGQLRTIMLENGFSMETIGPFTGRIKIWQELLSTGTHSKEYCSDFIEWWRLFSQTTPSPGQFLLGNGELFKKIATEAGFGDEIIGSMMGIMIAPMGALLAIKGEPADALELLNQIISTTKGKAIFKPMHAMTMAFLDQIKSTKPKIESTEPKTKSTEPKTTRVPPNFEAAASAESSTADDTAVEELYNFPSQFWESMRFFDESAVMHYQMTPTQLASWNVMFEQLMQLVNKHPDDWVHIFQHQAEKEGVSKFYYQGMTLTAHLKVQILMDEGEVEFTSGISHDLWQFMKLPENERQTQQISNSASPYTPTDDFIDRINQAGFSFELYKDRLLYLEMIKSIHFEHLRGMILVMRGYCH